ncbi:MAG: hypothetical protein PVI97_14780, partial [Candidatus Thiodiazotropha sp.]
FLNGVDMKATLRSSIRGEDRIYVRRSPLSAGIEESHETDIDPTVFIFTTPRRNDNAVWHLYSCSMVDNNRYHIKNLSRFDEVVRNMGEYFVEGVGFVEHAEIPERLQPFVNQLNLLRGIMVFGCPSLNAIQEAKWLEETDYSRAPIFGGGGNVYDLLAMYRKRHGMHLDPTDWTTTLVQLAIPYARHRVVVVAPDHFTFRSVIFQDARAHRVHIAIVPLSYFSAERIQKLTRQYGVQPEDRDGLRYSQEIERLLGQSVQAFSELLPRRFGEQGMEDQG